jgi:thioredoxin-like negative regulator of GroEL
LHEKHEKVVIAFTSNSCQACGGLEELFTAQTDKNTSFMVINLSHLTAEEKAALEEAYSIQGYPLTIFFKQGKEVSRLRGGPVTQGLLDSQLMKAFGGHHHAYHTQHHVTKQHSASPKKTHPVHHDKHKRSSRHHRRSRHHQYEA